MFRVAVSSVLRPEATTTEIGLDALADAHGVNYDFLSDDSVGCEIAAEHLHGYDALLLEGASISAASLRGNDRLALIARFGVGYDNVDVAACTANGTLVTITPDGVRRPLAVAAITMVLALSQHLILKDRLTRSARWLDASRYLGFGLQGRTLGVIGLGNVGKEVMRLIEPFGMRKLTADPHVTADTAESVGAELVDVPTLLRESDFVVVLCPLTPATHHLLDATTIGLMKSTAYLVNVSRGSVVDQVALTDALRDKRIAGAGLDVFETEPVAAGDPLLGLENVLLSPHSLCATDQCLKGCGESAIRSILEVATGKVPSYLVNDAVLELEQVQKRLAALQEVA